MFDYDIVVIGGGVIGCATARLLARYEAKIALFERAEDVADGASKANSGIVHAGFDAKPGTNKARLNVRGSEMYEAFCAEVGAPYGQPGALVLGFTEDDRKTIDMLYRQGIANGVKGLSVIERDEILALEPNTNPDVLCALRADTSGLTSPYELTCALADHAAVCGVEFKRETEVIDIQTLSEGGYILKTNKGEFRTRALVNCAGVGAGRLRALYSKAPCKITARKGEYYLLDHTLPLLFSRTMFQTPTKMGKGVLVSPTLHGNTLLGPSAEDVTDGLDVSTTPQALRLVGEKARLTWPQMSLRSVITTFAGVRAHEQGDDFIIGKAPDAKNAYEAIGIESPGLSAAPAIAEELCGIIVGDMKLNKKASYPAAPKREKPFYAMTTEERAAAYEKDKLYGNLVCRCEQVTEAEIRAAIRRPVGARSIDAIKRRTRAGMGRCQGGFCSPRVLSILAEELHLEPTQVTKCGGESKLLVSTIRQARKGNE